MRVPYISDPVIEDVMNYITGEKPSVTPGKYISCTLADLDLSASQNIVVVFIGIWSFYCLKHNCKSK